MKRRLSPFGILLAAMMAMPASPSLAAFNRLAQLGAFSEVVPRIIARDTGLIAIIIRHGLGWKDAEAKHLPNLLFKTGTQDLWEPCYNYFFCLFNNGKTAEQLAAENSAKTGDSVESEEDEGNALTGA